MKIADIFKIKNMFQKKCVQRDRKRRPQENKKHGDREIKKDPAIDPATGSRPGSRNTPHFCRKSMQKLPMLVLDDEADNASINTRGDEDPTVINGLIRDLLSRFEKNCYVGYTATPFANIFINPDSSDEMLGEDLFPRDFIVSLDAPDNYVGASRVFGEDEEIIGKLKSTVPKV